MSIIWFNGIFICLSSQLVSGLTHRQLNL